ncbi:unnamed protein product [Pieris macdunnoughi]|uniref:Uncharacterized protein n=1 Tax=Pieris macdunnoughi TaxID=345717 RepID=A0A821RFG6_9NEOP|nr:unnamed protein product [Pieris macdunnoughi]
MSRGGGSADALAVIKEEQASPVNSASVINNEQPEDPQDVPNPCPCKDRLSPEEAKRRTQEIEKLLKEKEDALTAEFQSRIEKEVKMMKERFDYILQNEQIRTSHMMREAHRERKEKVSALQTQLECKNLAGLMYVMCSERRKSRLQLLRLVEDYTTYITGLQHILAESQALILNLSRGYKTAARVEQEWKEKMDKVIKEFLGFIYHYAGGTPETNQYFFDIPALMQTKAPIKDDPKEDPCDCYEVKQEETETEIHQEKNWWEMIEGDDPPFVIFGDMADFNPPERREVLKSVKAAKTAPKKWKEYVFHEMFHSLNCPNLDTIKDEFLKHQPKEQWECRQTDKQSLKGSDTSQKRVTRASIDIRGTMGSILKIITSSVVPKAVTKSTLLGARDSMEIASTTKLREKQRQSTDAGGQKVVLNVGKRIDSLFNEMIEDNEEDNVPPPDAYNLEDEELDESLSALGSLHNDSLSVIPSHVPDHDHKIHYEKTCPMEQCQAMKMDSFIRTLPPYMQASPFTQYEQTFDEYEPCSPEQLEILKQRIEEKKKREKVDFHLLEESPLSEWPQTIDGVGVQTSNTSVFLPPCTCGIESVSDVSSIERVFKVTDLIPLKEKLEKINQQCFFRNDVDFDRFGVIGQEYEVKTSPTENFAKDRLRNITKILKQNPSLCEIFQANIR